jgi:hypothetical protein
MNFYDILVMLAGEPTDIYQVILLKTFCGDTGRSYVYGCSRSVPTHR